MRSPLQGRTGRIAESAWTGAAHSRALAFAKALEKHGQLISPRFSAGAEGDAISSIKTRNVGIAIRDSRQARWTVGRPAAAIDGPRWLVDAKPSTQDSTALSSPSLTALACSPSARSASPKPQREANHLAHRDGAGKLAFPTPDRTTPTQRVPACESEDPSSPASSFAAKGAANAASAASLANRRGASARCIPKPASGRSTPRSGSGGRPSSPTAPPDAHKENPPIARRTTTPPPGGAASHTGRTCSAASARHPPRLPARRGRHRLPGLPRADRDADRAAALSRLRDAGQP